MSNKKSLVSEVSVSQSKENVDSFGRDQIPTVKVRKACHICHGMGVCERPGGGDTFDCPNRACEHGFVWVNAPKE